MTKLSKFSDKYNSVQKFNTKDLYTQKFNTRDPHNIKDESLLGNKDLVTSYYAQGRSVQREQRKFNKPSDIADRLDNSMIKMERNNPHIKSESSIFKAISRKDRKVKNEDNNLLDTEEGKSLIVAPFVASEPKTIMTRKYKSKGTFRNESSPVIFSKGKNMKDKYKYITKPIRIDL